MTNIGFSTKYPLSREELFSFDTRLERMSWLEEQLPKSDFYFVQGIPYTTHLFKETIRCFVNAQFLAAIALGFSVIEHSLAARFCEVGQDLKQVSAVKLLDKAKALGWLTDQDHKQLNEAREFRNPVIHFRNKPDPSRHDISAMKSGKDAYHELEVDAKHVLCAAIRVLEMTSI